MPRPHLPPTPGRGIPTTFCRWMPTRSSDEQLNHLHVIKKKRSASASRALPFGKWLGPRTVVIVKTVRCWTCQPRSTRRWPRIHGSGGQLRHQHVQVSPKKSEMPEIPSWTLYCGSLFLNTFERACSQHTTPARRYILLHLFSASCRPSGRLRLRSRLSRMAGYPLNIDRLWVGT